MQSINSSYSVINHQNIHRNAEQRPDVTPVLSESLSSEGISEDGCFDEKLVL